VLPSVFTAFALTVRALLGKDRRLDKLAYHGFALGAIVVMVGGAWFVGGGLAGPELVSLPMLPVLMSFLVGRRAAIAWTLVAIVWVVVLGVLEGAAGVGHFNPEQLHVMRVGVYATTLAIAAMVGLGYSYSVQAQAAALARSRDAAHAASAAKTAFLATMSHEIRTPLGAIVGVVDLLEKGPMSPEQAARVELLRRSADGLNALIGDVLDLARIESGRLDVHLAPVDIARLVRESADLFRALAAAKGLQFSVVGVEAPLWGQADALRIRQILVNLISNAVKFTDAGGVRVRLVGEQVGEVVHARFEVADTGPGIALDQQASIFDVFTQGDAARGRPGSGLGLAIGRELAARLGGVLAVRSAPGEGATFTLSLTLSSGERRTAQPAMTGAPRPGLRALLVEDNPINQLVFSALLEEEGCIVQIADGGEAGVAAALAAPLDIVFMDVRMPDLDGLEATRRLRRAGCRLPIFALTANALPEDRIAAAEAGMDGFLTKPLNIEAMRRVLQEIEVRSDV
jgi:signal transduction histidine kinase/ActR/RegA family two-component response regulator